MRRLIWALPACLALGTLDARASECQAAVSTSALQSSLQEAMWALEHLESARFVDATDAIQAAIPCLSEPLSRHQAAEVHRALGVRAVGDRDPAAAARFAAARSIEPAYTFPSALIPQGHPVRLQYSAMDLATGDVDVVEAPASGVLRFDGRQGRHRPADWPTLVQLLADDGHVRWTAYVMPEQPLPPYAVAAEVTPDVAQVQPVAPVDPLLELPEPRANARAPLLVASASGLVVSGVLYGLAGVAQARYRDPATPDTELQDIRQRTNSLVIASGFLGGASLGVGAAGLLVE